MFSGTGLLHLICFFYPTRLTESLSQPGKADGDNIRSERKMLCAGINKVSGVWFQIGARIIKSLLRFRVQTALDLDSPQPVSR